jgi:hypothetical protein
MTPQELSSLPVGSIVLQDGEEGEIVQAGAVCHIMWPRSKCTNIIDTNSRGWYDFISELEAE